MGDSIADILDLSQEAKLNLVEENGYFPEDLTDLELTLLLLDIHEVNQSILLDPLFLDILEKNIGKSGSEITSMYAALFEQSESNKAENIEFIPYEILVQIILTIKDGNTLYAFANTSRRVREVMSEPSILKQIKKNLKGYKRRIPLKDRVEKSNQKDFLDWYEHSFLTDNCEKYHGKNCIEVAFNQKNFSYLLHNKIILTPTQAFSTREDYFPENFDDAGFKSYIIFLYTTANASNNKTIERTANSLLFNYIIYVDELGMEFDLYSVFPEDKNERSFFASSYVKTALKNKIGVITNLYSEFRERE